jgi:hypothetical protein
VLTAAGLPSVGLGFVVTGTGTYVVDSDSGSGVRFTITRGPDGLLAYTCAPIRASCRDDGTGHGVW